jgi:hypothetical protein
MAKYGKADEDNPEWTKEDFARAAQFKDLPADLQRALSKFKRKGMVEIGEAKATADSLRE